MLQKSQRFDNIKNQRRIHVIKKDLIFLSRLIIKGIKNLNLQRLIICSKRLVLIEKSFLEIGSTW